MFDRLETLRLQPGHVRQRIAFLTALLITGLIATGWLAVATTSGTFALNPSHGSASDTQDLGSAFAQTKTGITSLLGAAAAFQSNSAGINVETQSSTTVDDVPTVLPF